MSKKFYSVFLFIALLAGCNNPEKGKEKAINSISADDMKKYISVLASDDFEGRAPSTKGETKTINYLAEQFKALGLEPANNGSYFQEVSLVKITSDPAMKLNIKGGKKEFSLNFSDDFIGGTPQEKGKIDLLNSEIVFIGYGINSPEYKWNDYEGLDLKGKTVLMLVNDPGYATGDTALFTGKAMTIYGRWTYKFEEAARQGASAAIIIHETGAAAYPWGVVQNSWILPKYYLKGNELAKSQLLLQSWVTTESAQKLFDAAGLDYKKITESASVRGFKPIKLNLRASAEIKSKIEYTKSNNVVALWPGKERKDEYIIYSAHWDHFGINNTFKGDSILNGAVDNATGVAALLDMAKAFTVLPERQERSIVFISVTCEEQGLLGSEFYAVNPIFPLKKTIGVINIDGLNITGPTKDMTIVGLGNSGLDKYATEVLKRHGRYVSPDPTPEKGGYFRSDHFNFAKVGVPALYPGSGVDDIEHGKEWALAETEKWITANYHKPSDNYEPDKWRFDGMVEDIKVFFEIGYDLSMTSDFPNWKSGLPFRTVRDNMMR